MNQAPEDRTLILIRGSSLRAGEALYQNIHPKHRKNVINNAVFSILLLIFSKLAGWIKMLYMASAGMYFDNEWERVCLSPPQL